MPNIKKSATYLVSAVLLLSPVIAYWQRQNIYDWYRLRGYEAPAEIASLADQTTMVGYARKVFYVARPELQDKSDFSKNCTIVEKTIVLGCYRSGLGIFVYNVSDARLNGVLQVTSAHEMLHAAYERLSNKERLRVDTMTAEAYASITDERIKKNVESYRARDAAVVPNELHSILGTEVRELPAELETYYKKYFTDRSKIVGYSEQYEAEFTKREDAVAAYDQQLKDLKSKITSLNDSLATQGARIEAENARLESLAAARKIGEYNASIPNYQNMINAYNADVSALKSAIEQYNGIVDARNAIVTEEQELINAIDSSVPASK